MNYYNILGISEDATLEQIKRAYRRKAKMFHPDIYKGKDANVAFQDLNEAYHTLISYDKRRYYDIKQKYNIARYKKYGINYERREGAFFGRYSYYSSYNYPKPSETINDNTLKYWSSITDNIFFFSMLLIGITAIIFGTIDLFFRKWKNINNLTGFAFGISFTAILIYGWYLRSKSDKKHIKTDFV